MIVKLFKAQIQTKRFRRNQKVWVTYDFANHAYIRFRWRGKGRWVNGIINKFGKVGWNKVIGIEGFSEIEIDNKFAMNLKSSEFKKILKQ